MWSKWLCLAEFWYNTSLHSAIETTPFEALYGYPPLVHIPYFKGSSAVHDVNVSLVARDAMIEVLKHHLLRAQQRMKQQHDKHRSERKFAIRGLGLFEITVVDKFGEVAYKIQLPPDCKIHHVFHVSQLKRKMGHLTQLQGSLPTMGNSTFLEPVQILESRLVKRGNCPATQVLVHWANSFPEDATWKYLHDLEKRFPHFKP
ncbi:uncharacterized protein LOC121766922 [Salvia splendens]|uniref:uncharacterized protein LOC121766922 n=1 Tax=Salvia splendens TaxID=180675 RepID=UPI001C2737B4|nr:uncharacterized protein LOC121766922 [Salvia splendens]